MSRLEFHDIHKSFGAVKALRGVSFAVEAGEAHAIVGENGAGKSTLLTHPGRQRHAPTRASCAWTASGSGLHAPRDALARGIGIVHQELLAFPNLTVTANIFAGRELDRPRRAARRTRAMRERTRELLARLHLAVSPDAPMESPVRGPSPARAGRARARLRVPHPGPGRAHDLRSRTRRPITCSRSWTACGSAGSP